MEILTLAWMSKKLSSSQTPLPTSLQKTETQQPCALKFMFCKQRENWVANVLFSVVLHFWSFFFYDTNVQYFLQIKKYIYKCFIGNYLHSFMILLCLNYLHLTVNGVSM